MIWQKLKLFIATLFVVTAIATSVAPAVHAGTPAPAPTPTPTPAAGSCPNSGSLLGFPRWYEGLCDANGNIGSPNLVGGIGAFIWIIVLNIVTMGLYVVGYVSLGFIIFGGFKYIVSGDNPTGVAAAKKTILNAVIGLVISIMAVGIVNVVANTFK
jgi:hypothetical protein